MKKLLFIIFLLFPSAAHAQSTSLSINPPVVEILIAPNKQVTQTFTLQAQGENISIIPELHLVHPSDLNGHTTIDPEPLNPSSISLTINSPTHHLGTPIPYSGSPLPITLTFEAANVDISEDIYLALVLRTIPNSDLQSSSITALSISALILVTINPTGIMPINLEVKDFSPPFFHDSWLPLDINPVLVNKAPIMIRPLGKYEVISPSGKVVFSIPIYPNLILGNSSRSIQGNAPEVPSPLPLSWSPTWSTLGPHRLHLVITTQSGTTLTDIEKIIWIIPMRIILIFSLFIILFIIYLTTRHNSARLPIDSTPTS